MLLTAFPQQDAGVVILRPGRECMPHFHARQRLLISAAPEEFNSLPLGEMPTSQQELAADPRLLPIFEQPRLLLAAGRFGCLESWVGRKTTCQWTQGGEGGYHHNRLVTHRVKSRDSAVRLCWSCDNIHNSQYHPKLEEIAAANRAEWVIEMVRVALRFPVWHSVTLPEFFCWTVLQGISDLLPAGVLHAMTGIKSEKITGTMRESDIQPTADPRQVVAEIVEQVKPVLKLVVDDEAPATLMPFPKTSRLEIPRYLKWVKTQPCCGCGNSADDAHHIIDTGLYLGGMGTKAHDFHTMPMCRRCHGELHRDVKAWEQEHGLQISHVTACQHKAQSLGVIAIA